MSAEPKSFPMCSCTLSQIIEESSCQLALICFRIVMEKSTAFFPDEIMINIFLFVPARILHNVMRYVCRQWYMIIHDPTFVSSHFLHATMTPLINETRSSHVRLLNETERGIEIMKFKFRFFGKVLSTCNGLVLTCFEIHDELANSYVIVNPATKKRLQLPLFKYHLQFVSTGALVFSASSKVYKVVVVFRSIGLTNVVGCAILTVGVDKAWRYINCADVDHVKDLFYRWLITSSEFVYSASSECPYILALDVEAESLKLMLLPGADEKREGRNYVMPQGNSISCWHVDEDFLIELWVLKDNETEEWVKLSYIKEEVIRREVKMYGIELKSLLYPVCWLRNYEWILFYCPSFREVVFVYDVKKRDGFSLTLEDYHGYYLIPYVNSLAWL